VVGHEYFVLSPPQSRCIGEIGGQSMDEGNGESSLKRGKEDFTLNKNLSLI
jgi:hypothetical protein